MKPEDNMPEFYTVGDLRKALEGLPDDMEIMIEVNLEPEQVIIHTPLEGGESDEFDGKKMFFLTCTTDAMDDEEEDDEKDEEDEKTETEQ